VFRKEDGKAHLEIEDHYIVCASVWWGSTLYMNCFFQETLIAIDAEE
jgi:hypothetical protein